MELFHGDLGLERMFGRFLLVYVDAQSRPGGRMAHAGTDVDRIDENIISPGHVVPDDLLNQVIRSSETNVNGGSGADRPLRIVARDGDQIRLGHGSDAPGFADAAAVR